jgi:hypothetical protein
MKLQKVCDTYLNEPFELQSSSPGYHRVVGSEVFLYFANIAEWRAAGVLGIHPKRRAGLWIPIRRGEEQDIRFLPAFEFTDCSVARTVNRELFGTPFDFARIEMPGQDELSGRFRIHTLMRDPQCLGRMIDGVNILQLIPLTGSTEVVSSQEPPKIFKHRRADSTYRITLTTLKQFPKSEMKEGSRFDKIKTRLLGHSPDTEISTCYQTLVDLPIDWDLPMKVSTTQTKYTLYTKDVKNNPIADVLGLVFPEGSAGSMPVEGFKISAPSVLGNRQDCQERARRQRPKDWKPRSYVQKTLTPPYELGNASFHGFVLPADGATLQDLLDKTFKETTGGEVVYRPFMPGVLFYFAKIRRAVTASSGAEQGEPSADVLRENEAGIWIPMVRVKKDKKGRDETMYPALYAPYMCVDSPYADAAGREVFGISKELARIDIPDDPRNGEFFLRPSVLKTLNRSSWPDQEILASVTPIFGSEGNLPMHVLRTASIGFRGLAHLLGTSGISLSFLGDLFLQFLLGQPRFAFLKQFPHAQEPTKATYQSVLEVPFNVQRLRKPRLLGRNYQLTLNNYSSHPWTKQFGLDTRVFRLLQGFSFNMDFEMNASRTLWEKSRVSEGVIDADFNPDAPI